MAKSFAIGGMVFLLLSIAPIPTKHFSLLRTVAAGIGGGVFTAGYYVAKADEKREQEIAIEKAKIKEEEDFEREQAFKDRLAIAASQREVLTVEAKQKEAARIQVAIADYTDDVHDAYVAVQDGKGRLDRVLGRLQPPEPEHEQTALTERDLAEIVKDIKETEESFATKKAKLLKFLTEHEGGWILQCMKKPILIYGDQGSGKSYFAEFLALCRYYLRGHKIVSIADPHFHQNQDYCWQYLIKLGVPGFGTHHNYCEVNSQIEAMYDRFTRRTLEDHPITSIFDEVTRYGQEEATQELAAKFGSKLSSDPRKANESPILISHAKTLAALGGGDGFAEAIAGNFIRIKLNSNSEQEPLWRGTISGIKDEDGEPIENQKFSIAPDWIRSSWVYNLFNSEIEIEPEIPETAIPAQLDIEPTKPEVSPSANKEEFLEQARKWLNDIYEPEKQEGEVTPSATPWDDVPEVIPEAPQVRNSNASANTSLLPEDVRSTALTRIIKLLSDARSPSDEVINLMASQPDRAVWTGIKLLGKTMTASSRDIFNMGSGGKKFQIAKGWYESLKREFD